MFIKTDKKGFCRGSVLISTLVAVTIILIAVIGTSNFRYYTALDTRKATAQTEAAGIALLLCESWRGVQGDPAYDPVTNLGSDLAISKSTGPQTPDDFTRLDSYLIKLVNDKDRNGKDDYRISYYVTMSWKDIQPGLRALNVNVAWARRDSNNDGYDKTDKSFMLTIYTLTS